MSESINYEDEDIHLSLNNNYNGILTEEDLKQIDSPKLKSKAIIIHEEIFWLKNYKYMEQKLKIIFEVIYLIFQENKKEICITKINGGLKSYLTKLNYLLNRMIYNQTFSNFKIIKIKNDIENYQEILKDMIELDWNKKRNVVFTNEKLSEIDEMVNRTFENLQSLLKFSVDGKEKKDINSIKINIEQEDDKDMEKECVEQIKKEKDDIHIETIIELIKEKNCNREGKLNSYPLFYLYLYNINDINERLEIENKILIYKEKSDFYVKWLNNQLSKDNLKKEDIDEIIRELISEMCKFKYESILKEHQNAYSEILCKFYQKFNDLLNNPSIPKDKFKFKFKKDINSRDAEDNNKTELHKKFENYNGEEYNYEIINLIKLGANSTLRDDEWKIPFDFIDEQDINNICSNLKKISTKSKEENGNREERLRILKFINDMDDYIKRNFNNVEYRIKFINDNIVIETSEKDFSDEKKEYFEELKNFVKEEIEKNNVDDDNNNNLIYEKLNLHIWHNENYSLKKEREIYFMERINENDRKIIDAEIIDDMNNNAINEMNNNEDKPVLTNEKENNNLIDVVENAKRENNLIQKYLLEESNKDFINSRNKIINELEILINNNYSEEMNDLFVKELEKYFKEYPSQIEIIIEKNNTEKMNEKIKDYRYQKRMLTVFKNLGIKFEMLSENTKKIIETINNETNELNEIPNKNKKVNDNKKEKEKEKENDSNENENENEIKSENENENKNENENEKTSSNLINDNGAALNINSNKNETDLLNNDDKPEDINKKAKMPTTIKKVIIDEPKNITDINSSNYKTLSTDIDRLSPFGNQKNENDETPSFEEIKENSEKASYFVSKGKFDEVKEILSNCKQVILYQKGKKQNLLSQMVIKLKKENLDIFVDIVKEYPEMINNIELATNVNNKFLTPLHYIIEKINQDPSAIEIIEKILPFITNSELLKIKDKDGMSIFDRVISINNMEAFKLLYEKILKLDKNWISRKENFIHVQYALLNNKTMTPTELKSIIENIIAKKSEVDELPYNDTITEEKNLFLSIINDNTINHQQSLLHIASYINNKNIVGYLLKQDNINLDIKDEDGRTPLFYAILSNNNSIAFKLIKNGANINFIDNLGMTPIFYAVFSKNVEIINVLIREAESNKIDILMKKDFYQRSPLNYSLMMENEKMVNTISNYVNKFEKINDIDKRNVLHYAVACKNINNIKSIFSAITNKNKVIFNHVDNNGRTALHYAAVSKNCKILEIFLNHKDYFDFHIKDHFGFKAVDYLLMDEINGDDFEYTIQYIISHMINDERMFKGNYYGKNIFFSAFSNPVTPDKAVQCILNVFETNKLLDKIRLLITPFINKDTMILEIGLKNAKISDELLENLIKKTELEKEIDAEILKEKFLQYNRKELAIKLGLLDIESNAEIANKLIENRKSIPELKSLLHIPKNIECEDFKSLDYAILLDKYNWYLECTKTDKMDDDTYQIKEKVLKYNSLNILTELLKLLFNFTDKSLWKIASEEAKEIIIKHYKKIGILEKEIIRAANDSNINFVKKGLNSSINSIVGLLHLAVHNNSKKLAKVILDKYGKKVFEEKIEINGQYMTASEYILYYENGILNKKEILTYLIMNGAPISDIKRDNLNEIEESVNKLILNIKEKANLLELSIDEFENKIDEEVLNKNNINEIDSMGNTLIFYAIENNDREKVDCLIDKFPNLNVNIENSNHETPLYYAIKYASKDIVELLIKKGSNIEVEIEGKSMLHYAFKRKTTIKVDGNKEIIIMEAKIKYSVALLLMKKGLIDLAPSTINEKVKYNWGRNYEDITQLMYQIIEGNDEKAKKLINSDDIDLSIKDSENCSAYAYAKYKKNTELIQLLEEKGCDKEEQEKILKDFFGLTNTRTAMTMSGGFILESFDYLTKNTPVEKLYNLIQSKKIIEMGLNFIDDDKKDLMNEMIRYKKKFEQMIS